MWTMTQRVISVRNGLTASIKYLKEINAVFQYFKIGPIKKRSGLKQYFFCFQSIAACQTQCQRLRPLSETLIVLNF